MVTHAVVKKNQGFSLVEFMVAALLGSIALITIGSVLIATQKSASEKNKQIMLLQNMSTALQQLKEDVLRAGFDGDLAASAKFSGVPGVTYSQTNPDALGYVYKVRTGNTPEYRHVVYWLNSSNSNLILCEKSNAAFLSVYAAANSRGHCYSVFDPKQISVSQFSVTHHQLENSVKSAFIIIRLSAFLTKDPLIKQHLEIKVTQRNWQ